MGRKIRERENFFGKAFFSKERFMLKDERGQLSIDFLVGISLFILALLFMAHFIPGMFVPFQSETIDLSSVAYRTSVILVEDPGWWDNETGADYGEGWQKDNHLANVRRVGLAIDKEHPNVLKMSKITGFNTQIDDANLTDKLGLYRNIGGNPIDYGYNITIVNASNTILAARGEIPPEYGDVVKMKRIASVQISEHGDIDASNMGGASSPVKPLLVIDGADVSDFCTDDFSIRISNFSFRGGGPPGQFLSVKIVQTNLSNFPDCDLHNTGNGLHIKDAEGTILNKESDGRWQVNSGSMEPLGDNADIFDNDTFLIAINESAFIRAGINTSTNADDVVLEISMNKIKCDEVNDPVDLLRYSETDAFYLKPATLIVKVWT